MNEIVAKEKDINDELFWSYFKYRNPLLLAKDLITATEDKNGQLVNNVNDESTDIRNSWKWKSEQNSQHPWKTINFNKQQKGNEIKILTPEQIL